MRHGATRVSGRPALAEWWLYASVSVLPPATDGLGLWLTGAFTSSQHGAHRDSTVCMTCLGVQHALGRW